MKTLKKWSDVIRAFRRNNRLTQQQLADLLPCHKRTVENWEGDKRQPPDFLGRALENLEQEITK